MSQIEIQQTATTNDETSGYLIKKAENGSLPDMLIRVGICKVLHDLANYKLAPGGPQHLSTKEFIQKYMRTCESIAIDTDKANEQHYELPYQFFELCLGDNLKYSSGYYPDIEAYPISASPSTSVLKDVILGTSGMCTNFGKTKSVRQVLSEAETNMLKLTLERADIQEGQCVLELGCGWGSASMYIMENFTDVKVIAISNSRVHAECIMKRAQAKGCEDRIKVIVTDVSDFERGKHAETVEEFIGKKKFDRIFSIGMIEHIRNWEKLLNNMTTQWLEEEGKLFLDYFVHKSQADTYETTTWMGKYFFTGGILPCHDLLENLDQTIGKTLEIEAKYDVNGRHYAKSSEAWLKLCDEERRKAKKIMEQVYGREQANVWLNRWRIYFMSLSEFFRMREGTEWFTAQYLLKPIKVSQ
jgi:cyclopropane-fatty-acyl-phospholipid synthase